MKKLELHLGGHPLKTDNFSHVMDGITEAFEALCKGVAYEGQAGFILWGCELTTFTSTDVEWTAGAVYLNGEICMVDAGSATKTVVQSFKWQKVTNALPIDPQAYANAASHDVHLETKAVIVSTSVIMLGVDVFATAPRLIDIVSPKMKTITPPPSHVTAEDDFGNPVAYTSGFLPNEVRYRSVNKLMTVDFRISGSLDSAADNIFIRLPDSGTCNGEYSSVMFYNDTPVRVKAEDGQNAVKVMSGSSDSFNGSFDLAGQVTLEVV